MMSVNIFLTQEAAKFTNPQKFSPSKILGYTVIYRWPKMSVNIYHQISQ